MGLGMEFVVERMLSHARRAVFLDRDGTLVHARHYPTRPEELIICNGVVAPLRTLQRQGFMLVLVTNQSGVARGYLTEADLLRMHRDLVQRLRRDGIHLDAVYYCPHHPDGSVPEYAGTCDCRKPAPGMLRHAAAEHRIDLSRSWLVGDILDDVEAGRQAGCRTVLVDLGTETLPAPPSRQPDFVAGSTAGALQMVLAQEEHDARQLVISGGDPC